MWLHPYKAFKLHWAESWEKKLLIEVVYIRCIHKMQEVVIKAGMEPIEMGVTFILLCFYTFSTCSYYTQNTNLMSPLIQDISFYPTKLQHSHHHDAWSFYAPPDLMEQHWSPFLPQILPVHAYLQIKVLIRKHCKIFNLHYSHSTTFIVAWRDL